MIYDKTTPVETIELYKNSSAKSKLKHQPRRSRPEVTVVFGQ